MKIFNFISRHRSLDIIFLLLLNIFCHRGWFMPGIIEYGDWSYYPKDFLIDSFTFPFCWTSRFFSGPQFMLCGWPLQWLMGLVANLGFDFGVAERVTYFFPYIIISVAAIYYLTYVLFKKRIICFFSTLLYIFNIFTIGILNGALMDRMVAYALMPLVIAFFIKGEKERKFTNHLLSGLLLAAVSVYELRVAYMISLVIVLFFFQGIWRLAIHKEVNFRNIAPPFFYLSLIFLVPLILNFYWLYPSFVSKSTYMISGYNLSGWVRALSYGRLQHCLMASSPAWSMILSYPIPMLVFLAIIFRYKDNNARVLILLAIASVMLAKGSNPPFGEAYIWLFKHIPGFNAFRDPGKFSMLTCLAYAPLLGISVEAISTRLKKLHFNKRLVLLNQHLNILFLAVIFILLMQLVWPFTTGKEEGAYYGRPVPEDYRRIEGFIKSQQDSFRTFWRPYHGAFSFYSEKKYPIIRGHYSPLPTHFFISDIWSNAFKDTKHIAKILGLLNVKYCFLPLEKDRLFGGDKDFYISTFNNQEGLKKIDLGESIIAYENKNFAPHFFATYSSALIVGNRKTLFKLASVENMDLSRWALYFSDETKEFNIDLLTQVESILFYERGIDDLVLASVNSKYRIDLFPYATKTDEPIPDRWQITDMLPAHAYGTGYGEMVHSRGGAIAPANPAGLSELTHPIMVDVKEADTYEVWLRATTGPDRGELSIWKSRDPQKYKGEQILKNANLRDNNPRFKWVKANDVYLDTRKTYFQIINKDGGMLADVLVIIPKKVIDKLRNEVKVALYSKSVITFTAGEYKTNNHTTVKEFFESKENIPVAWEQVNPTKYKVKLKTEKPTYLIFSDLYDPRWSLNLSNPVASLPAYSLINSFFIANPGEIDATVEFTPQRYVYRGLLVSGIGFILICLYLLWQAVKWTRRR